MKRRNRKQQLKMSHSKPVDESVNERMDVNFDLINNHVTMNQHIQHRTLVDRHCQFNTINII